MATWMAALQHGASEADIQTLMDAVSSTFSRLLNLYKSNKGLDSIFVPLFLIELA